MIAHGARGKPGASDWRPGFTGGFIAFPHIMQPGMPVAFGPLTIPGRPLHYRYYFSARRTRKHKGFRAKTLCFRVLRGEKYEIHSGVVIEWMPAEDPAAETRISISSDDRSYIRRFCRACWAGVRAFSDQVDSFYNRHGPACPGHLSKHTAGTSSRDKPGYDGSGFYRVDLIGKCFSVVRPDSIRRFARLFRLGSLHHQGAPRRPGDGRAAVRETNQGWYQVLPPMASGLTTLIGAPAAYARI